MGKTLIIAEKPSVARDLAAVLGSFDKCDGFLENPVHRVLGVRPSGGTGGAGGL